MSCTRWAGRAARLMWRFGGGGLVLLSSAHWSMLGNKRGLLCARQMPLPYFPLLSDPGDFYLCCFFMPYRWCSGVIHTWLCSEDRLRSWELKPGWPHVTSLCYHSAPHPRNIFSCQHWERTTSFLGEAKEAYTGISKFPIPNPSLAQKSVVKRHDLVYLGTKTISIY